MMKTILQGIDKQQECMLHALSQHVLGFSAKASDVHVTTEEVKQLGRVGHPHSKCQCISIAFLHHTIITSSNHCHYFIYPYQTQ